MPDLPTTGRAVRLVSYPDGLPTVDDFAVTEVPMPAPAADEVLVRNLFFRVSGSIRMLIAASAEGVAGVPYPPVRVGDIPRATTLGEIVAAPRECAFRVGDRVRHPLGWREYAAVPTALCSPVDASADPAAVLGHGATAYAALTRGAGIRPGDTVFVSSGGGAIGSMAGQIARLLGAGRVIGSTSTAAKASLLVEELGYDAAICRAGVAPLVAQLGIAAPDGIDVFLDSVGGEQLAAAVAVARPGARFALVGSLSAQLDAGGDGRGGATVELDSDRILRQRVTIRGYSADDDPDADAEWLSQSVEWSRNGDLRHPVGLVRGIDNAPGAIVDAIAGRYLGVVMVAP
jgi:2-alkenal reductase